MIERFVMAQESVYQTALGEIAKGRKVGHWIWYIFPQLKGLGHSYNSNYYGIRDAEEAKEYLNHSVLGQRLREITRTLFALPENLTARDILGGIDAMKVKSCMTLFYLVSREQLFMDVLNRYYEGRLDGRTIRMLGAFE